MTTKMRRGFTLVELLVVMVVISMLIALLLPAVAGVRERGRQLQCTNNQGEISKAILMYEMEKKHFPGWVNRSLATNPNDKGRKYPLAWPLVILAQLGREDLAKKYLASGSQEFFPGSGATPADAQLDQPKVLQATNLPVFVCPSDARQDNAALAYVANCGMSDADLPPSSQPLVVGPDIGASGLFMNLYDYAKPMVRLSDIVDGASETILISENVGALDWKPVWSWPVSEPQVGLFWWPDAVVVPDSARYINRGRTNPVPGNPKFVARPSSNHSGIAIAAFCDGSVRSLNEDTDPIVLRQMLTPNGALCGNGY